MAWYPECAATPETDEPTDFIPPTIGNLVEPELKRLRESKALAKVTKEAGEFHAKMSKKYGVESEPGLAHARAAHAYKESHQKLLEFFENGAELGELPPEVLIRTNQEAVQWHKKMAEKHGVDSDEGHAHVAMMEHHMDVMNKAKQQRKTASTHGVRGRQNPIAGVPEKKKQPSGDIRQNKPMMRLRGKNLANKKEGESGENQYQAPRYDKSHSKGQYEAPRYSKSHESKRFREGKKTATFGNGVPMRGKEAPSRKEEAPLPPGYSRIGNVVFKEF